MSKTTTDKDTICELVEALRRESKYTQHGFSCSAGGYSFTKECTCGLREAHAFCREAINRARQHLKEGEC